MVTIDPKRRDFLSQKALYLAIIGDLSGSEEIRKTMRKMDQMDARELKLKIHCPSQHSV